MPRKNYPRVLLSNGRVLLLRRPLWVGGWHSRRTGRCPVSRLGNGQTLQEFGPIPSPSRGSWGSSCSLFPLFFRNPRWWVLSPFSVFIIFSFFFLFFGWWCFNGSGGGGEGRESADPVMGSEVLEGFGALWTKTGVSDRFYPVAAVVQVPLISFSLAFCLFILLSCRSSAMKLDGSECWSLVPPPLIFSPLVSFWEIVFSAVNLLPRKASIRLNESGFFSKSRVITRGLHSLWTVPTRLLSERLMRLLDLLSIIFSLSLLNFWTLTPCRWLHLAFIHYIFIRFFLGSELWNVLACFIVFSFLLFFIVFDIEYRMHSLLRATLQLPLMDGFAWWGWWYLNFSFFMVNL